MKRTERKVLIAIMNGPISLDQLFVLLRAPTFAIRQAVLSLRKSGDIQFDGTKFHIKKTQAELSESLLQEPVKVAPVSVNELRANPPPRGLIPKEPKTRRRDRE